MFERERRRRLRRPLARVAREVACMYAQVELRNVEAEELDLRANRATRPSATRRPPFAASCRNRP